MQRENVDKTLSKAFRPGWYDVYTLQRLNTQSDCASYCRNPIDYIILRKDVSDIESMYID